MKWFLLTIIAMGIALMMWLPRFSSLPAGLNRDEAALGYNAFSLLKTGKDEWGHSWPISFTSFGDQKLPGYIYTLIPFIALFGLESCVIRLPSLMAGLVVIVCGGLISHYLARSLKLAVNQQLILSGLTMFLLAISPWQMHFSRVAYESHLAMAFFMVGLCLFLRLTSCVEGLSQRRLLIAISIFWSLAMLTYHSYQVFLPLFIVALAIIYRKKIKLLDKSGLTVGVMIGLGTVFLLFRGGVMQANQVKSIGISPFSKQQLLLRAIEYREASHLPTVISRIVFNRYGEAFISLSENLLTTFSGQFFLIHGSGHEDHNPANGANLHLILAPFIVWGIYFIWTKKSYAISQLLIIWLMLALVPSSLTIKPLLEVRIATIFPALELLAAVGMLQFLNQLQVNTRKWIALLLGIILVVSAYRLFLFYTVVAPRKAVDNSSFHHLAKKMAEYRNQSDYLLTQSPSSSPYIWYLLVNQVDPQISQQNRETYPSTDEGFVHVKRIENILFETIYWPDLAQRATQASFTLFLKPSEISETQRQNGEFEFLESISNQKGEVVYEVWRY